MGLLNFGLFFTFDIWSPWSLVFHSVRKKRQHPFPFRKNHSYIIVSHSNISFSSISWNRSNRHRQILAGYFMKWHWTVIWTSQSILFKTFSESLSHLMKPTHMSYVPIISTSLITKTDGWSLGSPEVTVLW
jgi:hypothetical protein